MPLAEADRPLTGRRLLLTVPPPSWLVVVFRFWLPHISLTRIVPALLRTRPARTKCWGVTAPLNPFTNRERGQSASLAV